MDHRKKNMRGWSVPNMCEVLGSIPSTEKEKNTETREKPGMFTLGRTGIIPDTVGDLREEVTF